MQVECVGPELNPRLQEPSELGVPLGRVSEHALLSRVLVELRVQSEMLRQLLFAAQLVHNGVEADLTPF